MVSSEEEIEAKTGDTIEWDVDMEVQLFYAMANHKPVGINKHFHMACIWEKLSNSITKEISTHDIWRHLETLYDIAMLDDTEPLPFPNHEVTFSLPENEFGALIKQKCKDAILGEDTEASTATTTASRKDSVTALSTKSRKESGSSHASTDTPSTKSEKDYDRRRDSRDSNASGPRDGSNSRKSTSQKDKTKPNRSSAAAWESPLLDEDSGRRGRRRANTSTPPATTPAKRRRT
ncbi:MRG/MORF4L-binding protein isoform X2 [Hyposmocoma kahamanoa]|uniref:MRG/MORF4L-binding protein isoform X2 n=1 Tax=Hyposmocoma kahamanoa TaxID=1477025 RepID=UPI000E6D7FFD|nr:MRG/MORF4L-binding protein isoform X2 [Hyposmocoma kahamanoa]